MFADCITIARCTELAVRLVSRAIEPRGRNGLPLRTHGAARGCPFPARRLRSIVVGMYCPTGIGIGHGSPHAEEPRERGATLIELMVALIVMAIGVLAIAQLFPAGRR